MIEPPPFVKPETWAEFVESRRSMPKSIPFTDAAARRIITKLAAFHADGWCVEAILDAAIVNGWRSVFVPRDCPRTRPIRAEAPHVEKPPVEDPVKLAAVMQKARELGSKWTGKPQQELKH